ncbi:hypothetical protein ACFYXM_11185 [Streptomyces sp. NPDC002476]|uniref:hypothetical protein n=1 Tax=Streptomyces sp. NPDC002476 TaxID=3364648 RepID=UPI0036AFD43F
MTDRYEWPELTVFEELDVPVSAVERFDGALTWYDSETGTVLETMTVGMVDGRPVVLLESVRDDDGLLTGPDGKPHTAWGQHTVWVGYETVDEARADRDAVFGDGMDYASSPYTWGRRYQAHMGPAGAGRWHTTIALGDSIVQQLHTAEDAAESALLSGVGSMADHLTATEHPVDALGATWLRMRAAEHQGTALRAAFAAGLDKAKEDRVVDRYGEISNGDIAHLTRTSPQNLAKLLGRERG